MSEDYIEMLCNTLTVSINNLVSVGSTVNVKKRNKRLKDGDFVVTIIEGQKCVRDLPLSTSHLKINLAKDCEIKVSGCQFLKENLFVNLERKLVLETVINDVFTNSESYGCFVDQQPKVVLLTNPLLQWENETRLNLEYLRSILAFLHIWQLLRATGFKVFTVPANEKLKGELKSLWPDLEIELENTSMSEKFCSKKDLECLKEHCISSLHKTDYTTQADASMVDDAHVAIDCKKFLMDKDLCGKYSKNIKIISYHKESTTVQQIAMLEMCRIKKLPMSDDFGCIHVVPKSMEYQQQLVDLGWCLFSSAKPLWQKHLVCNTVTVRKPSEGSSVPFLEDYICQRELQMKDAFESKHGVDVADSDYTSQMKKLTGAAIKFDFLLSGHSSILKLDLNKPNTKGGIFVMYNYARLATLFSRFEKSVAENVYPCLPQLDQIDWSLLREEEEWELFFNYVITFPSVVKESVGSVFTRKERPNCSLHTHTLCQFLQDLSFCLSSYYNRVHILTEPYTHLLSLMNTRIYLLKAVQQVMRNGLALLQIEPLEVL